MKKMLLQYDWDVIAGVLAAVIALVLHFLHFAEIEVVFAIMLALIALLLLRDLRSEGRSHRLAEEVDRVNVRLREIQQSIVPPDALLIGPQRLLPEFERFAVDAQGDLTWYNVCCLMFKRQEVFDATLRMAIDNPRVTSIQLICDEREKTLWESDVQPKVLRCAGAAKVREPMWGKVPETISFILADTDARGRAEVLLSFWGEPFMARTLERSVPRYIFRVHHHSELVGRLAELIRQHRMLP
jgi:hypothetical protein